MHKRFLPTFVGLLLIAAALLLTDHNFREDARAGQTAGEIVAQLRQTPAAPEPPPTEQVPDPNREMPVKTVDGRAYVGTLSIPALSLELPVMDTWSYPNLKIAPCRFSGTPYRDDLVIAAHNYQSHFGGLKNLDPGDTVTFTDVEGTVFSYRVALLETLDPNAAEEMENGLWDLSLYTCTVGGEFRVTVRCERTEEDTAACHPDRGKKHVILSAAKDPIRFQKKPCGILRLRLRMTYFLPCLGGHASFLGKRTGRRE